MQRALATLVVAALLSGCLADPVQRPRLSAPAVTLRVPESAEYSGLVVQGTISGTGDGLRIDAVARNQGNRTYRVETGCTNPWTEELFRGDRERVAMREPRGTCGAFALMDFAPGEERTYGVVWDGRAWDEGLGRLVPASPGEYVWEVRFVAYNPASGDAQLKRFDLDFEVTVLEG